MPGIYVNAWEPQTFESFGILGDMKTIYANIILIKLPFQTYNLVIIIFQIK